LPSWTGLTATILCYREISTAAAETADITDLMKRLSHVRAGRHFTRAEMNEGWYAPLADAPAEVKQRIKCVV